MDLYVRDTRKGVYKLDCEKGSRKYFESVASKWDEMRRSFYSEEVREGAYKEAGILPGRVAADIGCGTGFITEGLLKKGLKVIAVDQSPAMLAQLVSVMSSPSLDARQGEAESLPIDDGSVDYAFANMFLHHVESPPVAIGEMARIIRPGGVLVITDMDEHDFDFLLTEQHDRWAGFARSDVREWFLDAGLQEVEVGPVGST